MSAVSELKMLTNFRDNMSAGFKVIQKEQLRIKKKIQDTKEVLKDTFGKKWSIKLQSIELLRYMREMGKEIGLLRKQLARMLQGFRREKPVVGSQIIVKSAVEGRTTDKNLGKAYENEKVSEEEKAAVYKPLEKSANKYDVITPSVESSGSKLVGDVTNNIVSKGIYELFDKTAKGKGGIGLVGKTLASLIGMAVSEDIKYIMNDLNETEIAGVKAEKQDLYMERTIKISNPSMGVDEVKKQRDEYMKLLRSNAEEAGFKPSEVLQAGDTAVMSTGGDIGKAIELVRVAEEMSVSNPGSTLAESMEALAAAKIGDIEGLKRFGAQVSYEELNNIGLEGIVQQKLKPQFVGGVEKYRNSDAGVMVSEEAYQENSKQKSGRVLLENKRKKERKKADETRRAQEYRKMDINEKVQQFKDIDGQHKRHFRKKTAITKSEDIAAIYGNQLNSLPTPTGINQPDNRKIMDDQEQQSGISTAYTNYQVVAQSNDANSNKPSIQNQDFTININSVGKSTNEIMNEMVSKLKLALTNATVANA